MKHISPTSLTESTHMVHAHAITSELADGSACAIRTYFHDGTSRGQCQAFRVNDTHLATISGVLAGLFDLKNIAVPGDTIRIKTVWGNQLPFFQTSRPVSNAHKMNLKSLSDIIKDLRDNGVAVSFMADADEPDPELVRHASKVLMQQRRRSFA
ncbi:hypothetical protein ACOI1H_16265 [Loktanella sp. DJP18]|uniref:hypothetical protein n=1 Tax=Loktanella sp. DJP18 TaxID=3409788 RepID=UPI003BB4C315